MLSIKKIQKTHVEKAIENLYGTVSQELHFTTGDYYLMKIIRFPHNEDTLAMLTFLEHYAIRFSVVGDHSDHGSASNSTRRMTMRMRTVV